MATIWMVAMMYCYLETPWWVKAVLGLFIGIDIAIAYKKASNK